VPAPRRRRCCSATAPTPRPSAAAAWRRTAAAAALRGATAARWHDEASDRWFECARAKSAGPSRSEDLSGDAARLQIATDYHAAQAAEEIAREQQDKVQFTPA